MKYLTLFLLLQSCAIGSFPEFPSEIKNHYMIQVRNQPIKNFSVTNPEAIPLNAASVRCLMFDIVKTYPYELKFVSEEPLNECNGVGGFRVKETQKLVTWFDEVYEWAKTRKHCLDSSQNQ